jgi:hypothetical protein
MYRIKKQNSPKKKESGGRGPIQGLHAQICGRHAQGLALHELTQIVGLGQVVASMGEQMGDGGVACSESLAVHHRRRRSCWVRRSLDQTARSRVRTVERETKCHMWLCGEEGRWGPAICICTLCERKLRKVKGVGVNYTSPITNPRARACCGKTAFQRIRLFGPSLAEPVESIRLEFCRCFAANPPRV